VARNAQVQKGQKVKHFANTGADETSCGLPLTHLARAYYVTGLAEFRELVKSDCALPPASAYKSACPTCFAELAKSFCEAAWSAPAGTTPRRFEPPPLGKGHLPEGLRAHLLSAALLAAERAHSLLCCNPDRPPHNIGEAAALLQAAADATAAVATWEMVSL
jgi:hypothetical protein